MKPCTNARGRKSKKIRHPGLHPGWREGMTTDFRIYYIQMALLKNQNAEFEKFKKFKKFEKFEKL
jgi:hypothetical protein